MAHNPRFRPVDEAKIPNPLHSHRGLVQQTFCAGFATQKLSIRYAANGNQGKITVQNCTFDGNDKGHPTNGIYVNNSVSESEFAFDRNIFAKCYNAIQIANSETFESSRIDLFQRGVAQIGMNVKQQLPPVSPLVKRLFFPLSAAAFAAGSSGSLPGARVGLGPA